MAAEDFGESEFLQGVADGLADFRPDGMGHAVFRAVAEGGIIHAFDERNRSFENLNDVQQGDGVRIANEDVTTLWTARSADESSRFQEIHDLPEILGGNALAFGHVVEVHGALRLMGRDIHQRAQSITAFG